MPFPSPTVCQAFGCLQKRGSRPTNLLQPTVFDCGSSLMLGSRLVVRDRQFRRCTGRIASSPSASTPARLTSISSSERVATITWGPGCPRPPARGLKCRAMQGCAIDKAADAAILGPCRLVCVSLPFRLSRRYPASSAGPSSRIGHRPPDCGAGSLAMRLRELGSRPGCRRGGAQMVGRRRDCEG